MDKPKVAVITGGARGIGKAICDAFVAQGVSVCTIDLLDNNYFVGDIADERLSQGDLAMKTTMNWETDLDQALKRTKGENKPIY